MKKISIIIVLFLIPICLIGQYGLAEEAFRMKNFASVINICNKISQDDPHYDESILLMGMSYQQMQDYQKALSIYESVGVTESVTVKYQQAECLELLGDATAAYTIYNSIYYTDSLDYHSLRNMARISLKSHDFQTSEKLYKILCDTFPTNFLYKKNLGTSYYNNKNQLGALDNFIWAWELNKRDLSLPISIANVYALLQAPESALEILLEGYSLDSLNIPILKTTAYINYKLERYKRANFFFQKSITAGDSSVFTHKHLGISLLKENKIQDSEPHLRIFFMDDTLNSEASYYLGIALTTMHKKEEGIKLLEYTIDLMNPDSVMLGSIYASIGRTWSDINSCIKSIEAFEKAIEYDPSKPMYIYDQAKMYDQIGRIEKSTVDYKLAIKAYNKFLEKQLKAVEEIRIERGLEKDQVHAPGVDYANERIVAIKKELFFLGELLQ